MMRPQTTSPVDIARVTSEISQSGVNGAAAPNPPRIAAPRKMRSPVMSDFSRLGATEQALRAEHENQCHHRVDGEQFELRYQMHGAGAEQSDDQGADQRPLHRAHSAER